MNLNAFDIPLPILVYRITTHNSNEYDHQNILDKLEKLTGENSPVISDYSICSIIKIYSDEYDDFIFCIALFDVEKEDFSVIIGEDTFNLFAKNIDSSFIFTNINFYPMDFIGKNVFKINSEKYNQAIIEKCLDKQ